MTTLRYKHSFRATFLLIAVGVMMPYAHIAQVLPALPGTARPAAKTAEPAEFKAFFTKASLDFVMEEYGDLTGRTALIAPGVAANITLQSTTMLTKTEYIGAIESILAMNGIALVSHGTKFVKVVKAASARTHGISTELDPWSGKPAETDEIVSRVVVLKHMEVSEAEKIVNGFKSNNANVQRLERINGMLITDSAINVARVLEILEEMDQPTVTREKLFVHPVRYAKPSELKSKLEEIIKDLKEDKTTAKPTVARTRSSGPPGVIRAPARTVRSTVTGTDAELERGLIKGNVKIVADDRTGILIFITLPANMTLFGDIIKALDIETAPDVMVKVFRLEFAEAKEIAGMLNTLIGAKVSGKDSTATPGAAPVAESKGKTLAEYVSAKRDGGTDAKSKVGELSAESVKILSDERTNSLIIMASRSDLSALGEIISDMDMMLSQVLIEAVIVEVQLSDSMQTGVDWVQKSMIAYEKNSSGGRTPVAAFASSGGGGQSTPLDATALTAPAGGGGLTYYLTHYGLNVDMVVKMASKDNRSRVVSAPVIVTTDNTEAKLTSTEQIYVFAGKKFDQNGNVTDDYKERDVGLELTVTPHINRTKVVMMEINQSMSEPGSVGEPQSGARVSSTRTLNASIAVRDRETIILGGQVRRDATKEQTKIPLLGDLPLIGRLFSYTSDSSSRTEMIVFITPYVLDTPDEIAAESMRRKRALNIKDMWEKGWSDSKMATPTREDVRKQERTERKERRDNRRQKKNSPSQMDSNVDSSGIDAKVPEDTGRTEQTEEVPQDGQKGDIETLINQRSSRWSKSLDAIDRLTPHGDI